MNFKGFNLIDTIKGITTGAINSLIINEEVEKMASDRISICRSCPYNSENQKKAGVKITRPDEHCVICGCNLHLKTRYPSAHCPKGDPAYGPEVAAMEPGWLSLATDEESAKILELLEKNNTERKNKEHEEESK